MLYCYDFYLFCFLIIFPPRILYGSIFLQFSLFYIQMSNPCGIHVDYDVSQASSFTSSRTFLAFIEFSHFTEVTPENALHHILHNFIFLVIYVGSESADGSVVSQVGCRQPCPSDFRLFLITSRLPWARVGNIKFSRTVGVVFYPQRKFCISDVAYV